MSANSVNLSELYKRNERISSYGNSVWVEVNKLVAEFECVNLGQGFPNYPCDAFVLKSGSDAILEGHNQYTKSQGHPTLVKTICDLYSDPSVNFPPDNRSLSAQEVVVTVGACESLYCTMQSLLNQGDEVIVIEPYFDFYRRQIELAGGKVVYIPLHYQGKPGDDVQCSSLFKIDLDELKTAINEKTRMLVLNSPHNPSGKVFTQTEYSDIAKLVANHPRMLVLCDEVYDRLVFENNKHVHFASLPGMWERTITVFSAGKTLSCTGWKIGWAIGPAPLIKSLWLILQYVNYTTSTPLQEGVSRALEHAHRTKHFERLPALIQKKRDRLVAILKAAGLEPIVPQGGYFILADTSSIQLPTDDSDETRDFQVVKHLAKTVHVAAIPPSAFYCEAHQKMAANWIRFCFMKDEATFVAAEKQLIKLKNN